MTELPALMDGSGPAVLTKDRVFAMVSYQGKCALPDLAFERFA